MIVLDTNVISELMRPEPSSAVVAWVASQPRSWLYTTSLNRAEILYGVTMMPPGRRRDGFATVASAIFTEEFAGRVLPFDGLAADHYARIVRTRRDAGMPIEGFDALIAATTAAAGYSIATRDVGGFEACGLTIINPWQSAGG
ncbi:type II toxin-antitoxin system VapC family toxin [Methylobacterium sp. J-092]|uniref:type II toxin-antitoxin system VapC family toxin n=1 Tax=Methylobacterium sp. J-092 TaxID=2836667 RepID=UPI001FB9C3C3|nr:type II toxin-antitoxin system VapC family toxin [Methylobacterium sp. J-092]MCJ2005857.1 type II toxin-antitoxin system VapC family toxin [Methylobacterium sp. J-092]